MELKMELGARSYRITIESGALHRARESFNLDRRVLIVTDSGVPADYAQAIAAQCHAPTVVTLPQGEVSKNLSNFEYLLTRMLECGFTRTDCVVAVGGGVVGDLSGFAAACYMRGIDFYNVPTTLLAQVDSSIGGKTAVDLCGVKNCVGAFWQPRGVLIDPNVLSTLPRRQLANGMAEAIKVSLTSDAALFEQFERADTPCLETVILRALTVKQQVVEQDECESGLRKILNFGHTLGHGIESAAGLGGLLHGECVALGMLPMCAADVRAQLLPVLQKIGLPTTLQTDPNEILAAVCHDKKCDGETVSYIWVPQVGTCEIRRTTIDDFCREMRPRLATMWEVCN